MDEYAVYEQEKSTILRIFRKGGHYGEPFVLSIFVSYWGKWNDVALLEGLDKPLTGDQRRALVAYFSEKGVRQVKWDHHEKHICYDLVERKMRIE